MKIPGLNFVPEPEEAKKSKKKKKKKAKGGNESESKVSEPSKLPTNAPPAQESKPQQPPPTTDPVKRLRNLRKKLKDIEALELKINSGGLENPEKEQVRVQRTFYARPDFSKLKILCNSWRRFGGRMKYWMK